MSEQYIIYKKTECPKCEGKSYIIVQQSTPEPMGVPCIHCTNGFIYEEADLLEILRRFRLIDDKYGLLLPELPLEQETPSEDA